MKARILLALLGVLLARSASAQTAAEYISQGRAALAAQDLTGANAAFAQAVALSPTNQTANAFYAFSRLLVLPSQPAGSNFLSRLGFPTAGRNLYHWLAQPPTDTNGIPLAPAGVNATELVAQLRTNVLPVVEGAIANLATVTDTNFTLNLASNETSIAAVTVDYGDLKLIQAGLYGAQYGIYTLNGQNLDAQLTDLRALYTQGMLSASRVMADYPHLLTFATLNDLQAARTAFTNGVKAYMSASAFIRTRPTGEVRLFNDDAGGAKSEADFRLTLQELYDSLLVGPQWLTLAPDLAVDMSGFFTGENSLRSLLPRFDRDAIELGSFPDLTFGDVVYGLTPEVAESALSKRFTMLPVGTPPVRAAANTLNVAFTTLKDHAYSVLASSDLVHWQLAGNFSASNSLSVWAEAPVGPQRYYRLRDDSAFLVFSGVVLDYITHQPIAEAQVRSVSDGATTFADANGHFYLLTSLPASWGSTLLNISAAGYGPIQTYYDGLATVPSQTIYLATPPANDNFANRTVLSGTNVSISGNNLGATAENGEPLDIFGSSYGGKSVWFSWTAPVNGTFIFSVSGSSVTRNSYPILALYTGTQLSALTPIANMNYSLTQTVTAGQTYQIELDTSFGVGGPYTLSIVP